MDSVTLLFYALAVSSVIFTPGPTSLLILNYAARAGKPVAACGIAGAALADLILVSAVGCGLGALLITSEQLFTLVRWCGAFYLLYLAWRMWKTPLCPVQITPVASTLPAGRSAFFRSLTVALSNPKALLFHSSFLPQFIQPEGDIVVQYITLAMVTAVINVAAMSLYAAGGSHAMRIFSGRTLDWLNKGCAGMLAGLGIALLLYRRHGSG